MFAFLVLSRPIISKVSLSMLTQYVSSALRLRVPQTIGQPTTRLCCLLPDTMYSGRRRLRVISEELIRGLVVHHRTILQEATQHEVLPPEST